ncbi:neuronal acetylcholine receptor subunit alpha-9-II-like isoform X2 [Apostichopus japonicus]|uniref:neuronal acetylcholine receptor subunit alpha-9-II-like isoform X2 n=1 Tax=Stichopus japonicus TaxID=307972 RepID=UPI003AB376B3
MFFTQCLLLTLMCIAFNLPFVESADMNTRNWLYHNLTDTNEYVKYLRPVNDSYQTVEVGFRFDPFIHELDYINQELQLRGTMGMTWYDFRLSWNPDDYDDLQYIQLPLTEIWQPELILYESDENFQTETDIVRVHNTGKVDWVTVASTRTLCSIDVMTFPKDDHTCDVTFTTWLHQDNEQNLYHVGEMESCKVENLRWNLQFTSAEGNESLYRCDQYLKNQSYVRYIAKLGRVRTQFDMFTLVAPTIFVSFLSLLTNCFPRENSNGPAFGLMCLLVLIMQLSVLYQARPDTGFCIMGIYIVILIVIVVLETTFSVIYMNIENISNYICKPCNCGYELLSRSAKSDHESIPPVQGGSNETMGRDNNNYQQSEVELESMLNSQSTTESDPTDQGGSDQSKNQPETNFASCQHSETTSPPGDRKEETTGNHLFVCKICVTVFFGISILVVNVVMFLSL